jgi:hypothetical protein
MWVQTVFESEREEMLEKNERHQSGCQSRVQRRERSTNQMPPRQWGKGEADQKMLRKLNYYFHIILYERFKKLC